MGRSLFSALTVPPPLQEVAAHGVQLTSLTRKRTPLGLYCMPRVRGPREVLGGLGFFS